MSLYSPVIICENAAVIHGVAGMFSNLVLARPSLRYEDFQVPGEVWRGNCPQGYGMLPKMCIPFKYWDAIRPEWTWKADGMSTFHHAHGNTAAAATAPVRAAAAAPGPTRAAAAAQAA